MATIRESISRIRNLFKGSSEDAFLTDRLIYSLIKSFAFAYMHREQLQKSLRFNQSLFREIPCLELVDASLIDECCLDIITKCQVKKSKEKLPMMYSLDYGPVINSVTSIDYSTTLIKTTPMEYAILKRSSSFKYNKSKYYWITDEYLYVPDVEWDAVRVNAMFEGDLTKFLCSGENACTYMQDTDSGIPDYLFAEIETKVLEEMAVIAKIPADQNNDTNNTMR
jgi:hypothetical protein